MPRYEWKRSAFSGHAEFRLEDTETGETVGIMRMHPTYDAWHAIVWTNAGWIKTCCTSKSDGAKWIGMYVDGEVPEIDRRLEALDV